MMMMMRCRCSLYPLLLVLLLATTVRLVESRKRKHGNPLSRSIRVINESGASIDLFWIHSETGLLADSNTDGEGIMYGGETGISSYVGHQFEVQEMPSKSSRSCKRKLCRKAYFTCNANEDQCESLFVQYEMRYV